MQISLELYLNDLDRDPFANVVCNAVPRVDEYVELFAGDTAAGGLYRVLAVRHLLDPNKIETLQHVCLIVMRQPD